MTEEHKKKLKDAREKSKLEKKEEFVTKKEFSELIGIVKTVAQSVSELKTIQQTPPGVNAPSESKEESVFPDTTHLPPKWREFCDQILGKDFGLNVTYPDTGKGFIIRVIVPKGKSNAPVSHWEFYKADIRSRAIGFGEGLEGVQKFYEKIKANLKLNQANIQK